MDKTFIASRLKEKREAAGLSQRALAAKAAVEPWDVDNLERGRAKNPAYTTITAIAAALEVDPDYFFAGGDVEIHHAADPAA